MTDLSRYEIDDANFVNDLKESDKHVEFIADWLRKSKGLNVRKRELKIRPNVEDMSEYSDDGDLEIIFDNGNIDIVEVKRRSLNFTSKLDFIKNYPNYDSLIIDVAHGWDKKDPKPAGYILTNYAVTHCFIVYAKTRKYWLKRRRWDKVKKRMRNFYECPLDYLKCARIK
jgi:hypothetical protein